MPKTSKQPTEPNAARLDPSVKLWLDEVLVPAMLQKWMNTIAPPSARLSGEPGAERGLELA